MEAGGSGPHYEEKQRKIGLNGGNKGGKGAILLPSDSVRFCHLPRTPVDIRGMRGRKMEDGSWEIMRINRENLA